MKITINYKTSEASGIFGHLAARISLALEGRKQWIAHNRLRFETSEHNLDVLRAAFPSAVVQDERLGEAAQEVLAESEQHPLASPGLKFVMVPRNFQLENFERFKDKPQWAIFSEQGTGKTKVALDIISWRYLNGKLDGVIVLSSPKGVHSQWVNEQIPKHLWKNVPVLTYIWDRKKLPPWLDKATDELQIFSGNIDMLKGSGYNALELFAKKHSKRLMILVDESDSIKNISSVRSKKLRKLAEGTLQRAIMTGTPIAKDLTDEWAQFYFLNPNIIGHKYLTSFRAQYCVMGGFEGKVVVGHKNLDNFKRITAPHIFRATKRELDLPEKVYDSVVFDLSTEQRRLIKDIRDNFFSLLASGQAVSVGTGATAMLRIQQISNGFIADEAGTLTRIANPRLDALIDLRRQITGPVVIWCRFKEDIRSLKATFKDAVTIFGEDSQQERQVAKEAFLSGRARELLATPGAAGKGIDGLQAVCQEAIYYSNSYNAIDRWQSEDRIHRIGMNGTATYFDLIARGSIDRAILNNLKRKNDISSLALDDIKQIIGDIM